MGLVSERQGDVHSAAFAFLVRGGGGLLRPAPSRAAVHGRAHPLVLSRLQRHGRVSFCRASPPCRHAVFPVATVVTSGQAPDLAWERHQLAQRTRSAC